MFLPLTQDDFPGEEKAPQKLKHVQTVIFIYFDN